MKVLIFISCILIILFKTGNVLSDNNIFNVNNIEIENVTVKNKEIQVNKAFQKAFDKLTDRILLKKDYLKLKNVDLDQVKKLVSYYQIISPEKNSKEKGKILVNVFFDRDRVHNYFYNINVLYSDIINTEVVLFPILILQNKNFIFNQNYFYENWNQDKTKYLTQYILPVENIENIQKINIYKDNLYKLNVSEFFNEYKNKNLALVIIEIKDNSSKVFLKSRIQNKNINKTLLVEKEKEITNKEFYNKIILNINDLLNDLIKSQNLIDVRTPSFLNVKIKLSKKNSLVEFDNRIKDVELIDNFFVQELNKDYVLIKIKYLGKINKLINKLSERKINLIMTEGQWSLNIT